MASTNPDLKQLKIRTGVVKRINKEFAMYKQEVIDHQNKIQKMEDEKKDPYDISKMKEVLAESQAMVPDTRNRLNAAIKELDILLEKKNLSETAEYKAAREVRDLVEIQ